MIKRIFKTPIYHTVEFDGSDVAELNLSYYIEGYRNVKEVNFNYTVEVNESDEDTKVTYSVVIPVEDVKQFPTGHLICDKLFTYKDESTKRVIDHTEYWVSNYPISIYDANYNEDVSLVELLNTIIEQRTGTALDKLMSQDAITRLIDGLKDRLTEIEEHGIDPEKVAETIEEYLKEHGLDEILADYVKKDDNPASGVYFNYTDDIFDADNVDTMLREIAFEIGTIMEEWATKTDLLVHNTPRGSFHGIVKDDGADEKEKLTLEVIKKDDDKTYAKVVESVDGVNISTSGTKHTLFSGGVKKSSVDVHTDDRGIEMEYVFDKRDDETNPDYNRQFFSLGQGSPYMEVTKKDNFRDTSAGFSFSAEGHIVKTVTKDGKYQGSETFVTDKETLVNGRTRNSSFIATVDNTQQDSIINLIKKSNGRSSDLYLSGDNASISAGNGTNSAIVETMTGSVRLSAVENTGKTDEKSKTFYMNTEGAYLSDDYGISKKKILVEGDAVKSVNGVGPDAEGNVEVETGVKTVNGVEPDAEGNVEIETGDPHFVSEEGVADSSQVKIAHKQAIDWYKTTISGYNVNSSVYPDENDNKITEAKGYILKVNNSTAFEGYVYISGGQTCVQIKDYNNTAILWSEKAVCSIDGVNWIGLSDGETTKSIALDDTHTLYVRFIDSVGSPLLNLAYGISKSFGKAFIYDEIVPTVPISGYYSKEDVDLTFVKSVNGVGPDAEGNVTVEAGGVKTVNGIGPDENGNVTVETGDYLPLSGGTLSGNLTLGDATTTAFRKVEAIRVTDDKVNGAAFYVNSDGTAGFFHKSYNGASATNDAILKFDANGLSFAKGGSRGTTATEFKRVLTEDDLAGINELLERLLN